MSDTRVIVVTTGIAATASVLSSTLLSWVEIGGVKPDLALVIIALVAMSRGEMSGQISGFLSGLLEDAISVSPLGFTAMIRTVVGFLCGKLEGLVMMDRLLLPSAVAVVATVMKTLVIELLSIVFSISTRYGVFSNSFLIEVALNCAIAPALYVLLSSLPVLIPRSRNQLLRSRTGQ